MAVAALAVIGLASLIVSVYRSVRDGKYQAVGSTLARQELERLRGDREELARLVDLMGPETTEHKLLVEDQNTPYNCTLRAIYMPSLEDRYLDVTCDVSWDQGSRIRNLRLETVLPRP